MKTRDGLWVAAKRIVSVLCLLAMISSAWGCSSAEGAGSNRGRYLTGLGYIYQPGEVHIDALIAQEDYDYPLPLDNSVGITMDADIRGKTGFIQIGLKAKKDAFEDIEPMNICFVIDISGSMSERDKLTWVKNAFYIFINNVRVNDIVSVVVFDNVAELLVPPTTIKNDNDRTQFKRKVDSLFPRNSTDILLGLGLGYAQVEQNYSSEYINRVILLTDGMHNGSGTKDDILDIVGVYNEKGINVSTIALGASADINLMVDMAINGGGSSRFISDYDQMEQAFGSELDRLVVPAARDISVTLTLSDGVHLNNTWGYKHWTQGNVIKYSLDTIHNGDYETMFAAVSFDKTPDSETKIAEVAVSYKEIDGTKREKIYYIYIDSECLANLDKIVNPRVKKAEGYAAYGQALINIGELSNNLLILQQNYESSRSASMRDQLVGCIYEGLGMIRSTAEYLRNISPEPEGDGYLDALTTLENYEAAFAEMYEDYTSQK